ncbi:MAG TPA: hypothetical protein VJI68_03315 [Candidatus Nanoarchaeia archaeon]|nr:hypothetical protein [Candidatus Nanoarchaeia archaeon]
MSSKIKREEVYGLIDKKKWIRGAWDNEPDAVKFFYQEDLIRLPCLLQRNPALGNWCGYVGVEKNNIYYRLNYIKFLRIIKKPDITYSKFNKIFDKVFGDKEYWYFGFDFGHDKDISPGNQVIDLEENPFTAKVIELAEKAGIKLGVGATYKSLEFAEEVLVKMAKKIIGEQKAFLVSKARSNK